MSMINIKYKKDLITIDLKLRQIRYLKNYKSRGKILFINIYNDLEGLEYLNNKLIKKCVRDELLEIVNIKVNIKNMRRLNLK